MRQRQSHIPLLIILLAAGLLSALPVPPERLVDAGSFLAAEGWDVNESVVSLLTAPFTDVARYFSSLAHRPVAALLSWLFWITMAFALRDEISRRRRPGAGHRGRAAGLLRRGLQAVFTLTVVLTAVTVIPWPAMRPLPPSSDWLLVDFHSHTRNSWDSLTTPEEAIRFHRDFGFDAFAVTDHETLAGVKEVRRRSRTAGGPVVLAGSEVRGFPRSHYLFIGLRGNISGRKFRRHPKEVAARARRGGAAVILSKWWRETEVAPLDAVDLPVDGVEIFNMAYGAPRPDETAAMIDTARRRGLTLVASNDWHGHGRFNRAWNALYIPGWRKLSRKGVRAAIVDALRGGGAPVVPLLWGRHEYDGPLRGPFEPFFGVAYLFGGMRPGRFLSWLLWIGGLWALGAVAAGRGIRRRLLGGAGLFFGLSVCAAVAYRLLAGGALENFTARGIEVHLVAGALGLVIAAAGLAALRTASAPRGDSR